MGELLKLVEPEDLMKFGMIPEFVGRLPVVATLNDLREDDLVTILTQPKNALVKQYQKLFEMEKVKLSFTKEALRAIAREAMRRSSGARGLRAIMEDAMLDIMYDVPYREGVRGVQDHPGGGHQARAAAAGAGEGEEDRLTAAAPDLEELPPDRPDLDWRRRAASSRSGLPEAASRPPGAAPVRLRDRSIAPGPDLSPRSRARSFTQRLQSWSRLGCVSFTSSPRKRQRPGDAAAGVPVLPALEPTAERGSRAPGCASRGARQASSRRCSRGDEPRPEPVPRNRPGSRAWRRGRPAAPRFTENRGWKFRPAKNVRSRSSTPTTARWAPAARRTRGERSAAAAVPPSRASATHPTPGANQPVQAARG